MRIGIMHVMAAVENTPQAEIVKTWDRLLRQSLDRVKNRDTEIVFRISRYGLHEDAARYDYMRVFSELETLQGYFEMGRAGTYDAIIVMCFLDSYQREARQALKVPFIGPGEAAMRVAGMMGKKFGVVCANVQTQWPIEENILKYGLSESSVGVKGLPESGESQMDKFADPHRTIANFIQIGRELIAAGAEIIIPGCMINDAIIHIAPGCEKDYPSGLNEIDGVPVMNVNQVALKMAETLATLKNAGSAWISRRLYYNSSVGNTTAQDLAAPVLEYAGPGFWSD